jgi:hypothetical protein
VRYERDTARRPDPVAAWNSIGDQVAEPVAPTREDRLRLTRDVVLVGFALAVGIAFDWKLTVLMWAGVTLAGKE